MKLSAIVAGFGLLTLAACQTEISGSVSGRDEATPVANGNANASAVTEEIENPLVASGKSYQAHGTEPFWGLTITSDRVVYHPTDGADIVPAEFSARTTSDGWAYRSDEIDIDITRAAESCSDGMSDIRYRDSVMIRTGGSEWHGCGGGKVAPGQLAATGWRIQSLNGDPLNIAPLPNGEGNLRFSDGALTTDIGCNSFTAPYVSGDDWLATVEHKRTQKACPGVAGGQRRIIFELLDGHANLRDDGEGMLIIDDGLHQMKLYRAACVDCRAAPQTTIKALIGDWSLARLNLMPVDRDDKSYFLNFDGTGYTASAGCNRMTGSYRVADGQIIFGAPASTRMACPGRKGEHEAAFLLAISQPMEARITGDGALFLANRKARLLYLGDSQTR